MRAILYYVRSMTPIQNDDTPAVSFQLAPSRNCVIILELIGTNNLLLYDGLVLYDVVRRDLIGARRVVLRQNISFHVRNCMPIL